MSENTTNNNIALATKAIELLPTLTVGVNELIAYINAIRTTFQQTGEWDEDAEQAFRQSLLDAGKDPAFQPDKPTVKGGSQ